LSGAASAAGEVRAKVLDICRRYPVYA